MQNGFFHFYNNWVDFGKLKKIKSFFFSTFFNFSINPALPRNFKSAL